jgi:hypothetical protein
VLLFAGLGVVAGSTAAAVIGAILTTVISLGASFALSAVAHALQKKPTMPAFAHEASSRTVSVRQPVAPWRIICGSGRYGGVLAFIGLSGPTNEWLHLIYVLAGHLCTNVGQMYFDGKPITIGGDNGAGGIYEGHVVREIQLGTDNEQGFPDLRSMLPNTWTTSHRLLGKCAVHVRLKWNADIFPSGVPNITWDVDGKPMLDPRTGLVSFSHNPAIAIYDYVTSQSYGLKATPDEIDLPVWIAAINACEESIPLRAGGTEARYSCNGAYEISATPQDIIPTLLSSCAGRLVYSNGKWGLYPGVWRQPVMTLTDDDLRGPIKVTPLVSRRELFNGIKGIYAGPDNLWQPDDFPAVQNPIYVAQDGGEEIWKDIELPFTASPATCQRLAKIDLERARRQQSVEAQCKLTAFRLQTPDTVNWTRQHFGWQDKPFEVVSHAFAVEEAKENRGPLLGIDLTLRETSPNVYDWNAAVDEYAPPAPVVAKPVHPGPGNRWVYGLLPGPLNVQLTSDDSTALYRKDGNRITRIRVTWDIPADQFVLRGGQIKLQYRDAASSLWSAIIRTDGDDGEYFIAGVHDGNQYYVRLQAQGSDGDLSQWVQAGPVTANGPISTIAPAVGEGKFGIVATPSTLHVYWDGTNLSVAIKVNKNDGTVAGPFADDLATDTLPTPNHDYYAYPYYDYDLDTNGDPPIQFVRVAGGVGNPPIWYDGKNAMASAALNQSGRTPVMPSGSLLGHTTSSGTTTGGGDTGCVRRGTLLVVKRDDVVMELPVERLRVGDYIRTIDGDGWTRVMRIKKLRAKGFQRITTAEGGALEQSSETPMELAGVYESPKFRATVDSNKVPIGAKVYGETQTDWQTVDGNYELKVEDDKYLLSLAPWHNFVARAPDATRMMSSHNAPMPKG